MRFSYDAPSGSTKQRLGADSKVMRSLDPVLILRSCVDEELFGQIPFPWLSTAACLVWPSAKVLRARACLPHVAESWTPGAGRARGWLLRGEIRQRPLAPEATAFARATWAPTPVGTTSVGRREECRRCTTHQRRPPRPACAGIHSRGNEFAQQLIPHGTKRRCGKPLPTCG